MVPVGLGFLISHREEVHFCHPRGNMTAFISTEEPSEATCRNPQQKSRVCWGQGSCSHGKGREKWRWPGSLSAHPPARQAHVSGSTRCVSDPLFLPLVSGHNTCLLRVSWRLNEIMYPKCLGHCRHLISVAPLPLQQVASPEERGGFQHEASS